MSDRENGWMVQKMDSTIRKKIVQKKKTYKQRKQHTKRRPNQIQEIVYLRYLCSISEQMTAIFLFLNFLYHFYIYLAVFTFYLEHSLFYLVLVVPFVACFIVSRTLALLLRDSLSPVFFLCLFLGRFTFSHSPLKRTIVKKMM